MLVWPEMVGWFLERERVQPDALEILQGRESKLVVSDQIKAEREAAVLDRVVEREMDGAARRRWARRLAEMVFVFDSTGRPAQAALAGAASRALADETRDIRTDPVARPLPPRPL